MTALDTTPETEAFLADALAGLRRPRKSLSPKYFYDAAGAKLFERITALREYYPTRVELTIMRRHAGEMAARCGERCLLVELGAGNLTKVRLLLDRLVRPAGYVPVDISEEQLQVAAAELANDYPDLDVVPVVADFTREVAVPAIPAARRVAYFPGSTLGNFDPPDADRLLRQIANMVGPGGGLLLGVDLVKDVAVIEAAYNDRAGVTAEFNLNVLRRMNAELGADFDLDAFGHKAFFNRAYSRIEMHLESLAEQTATVAGERVCFRKGETIHTENSHKYALPDLTARAARCGLRLDATWTDERQYFAVAYFTALEG